MAKETNVKKQAKPEQRPARTSVKKAKAPQTADLNIQVYGLKGSSEKTVELPADIFNYVSNPKLLAQYVRVYLMNQRQGTASTKTRSEVIGTTAKVYRQKGTGRARHGSKKANLFVGGGITFGPKPTDYSRKMNKKQKRQALLYALSMKAQSGSVAGLTNEFMTMKPKTKTISDFMKKIDMADKTTLIVLPKLEAKGVALAARNIPQISIMEAASINPYAVLSNEQILFVEDAIGIVSSHFKIQK